MSSVLPRVRSWVRHTQTGGPLDPFPSDNVVDDWSYDALIISEPHRRLPTGGWSGGGPFYSWHASCRHDGKLVHPRWTEWGSERGPRTLLGVLPSAYYRFPTTSVQPWGDWGFYRSQLLNWFPTAVAKTRPGNPQASLGVFLSELRDLPGIPGKSLFKTIPRDTPVSEYGSILYNQLAKFVQLSGPAWRYAKSVFHLGRSAGEEFLNLQFGWKPFLSDLRKFHQLQESMDKALIKLRHENGRWIRRRATLTEDVRVQQERYDVPYLYWGVFGGGPEHYLRNGHTFRTVTTVTETKRWFSGSYRYWIPDIDSPQWTWRAKTYLYGAAPTPKTLWEAMPWTWLIDWFSNWGDVVSNISVNAVGYPVLRWSFLMEHITETITSTAYCSHNGYDGTAFGLNTFWPEVNQQRFSSEYKTERKLRVEGGNPFGWGLPSFSWGNLTVRQAAILAALGITRGQRG